MLLSFDEFETGKIKHKIMYSRVLLSCGRLYCQKKQLHSRPLGILTRQCLLELNLAYRVCATNWVVQFSCFTECKREKIVRNPPSKYSYIVVSQKTVQPIQLVN